MSAYVTCRKQTTGADSDKKLYSQTRLIKKTGPTHVTPIAQNGRDCDRELDITDKLCPLTFVHTRLTIDSMQPGTVLAIVLNKGEPLENVPRSLKKGPYVDQKLEKRLIAMKDSKKKKVVKTWSRRSMVTPDFVGHTVAVHNGNKFIPVFISENMVGHKLGEFAPTRTFRMHSGDRKS